MLKSEMEYIAAALYDGGWRSTDKEELTISYELTSDEVDEACEALRLLEQD